MTLRQLLCDLQAISHDWLDWTVLVGFSIPSAEEVIRIVSFDVASAEETTDGATILLEPASIRLTDLI